MIQKVWLNLIVICGFCTLLSATLTAQQDIIKNHEQRIDGRATTSKATVQARALGQVTVISGPTACNGESCYELQVVCPQVPEPERLRLRVVNPGSQVPSRGTIMFMSGGGGTGAWDRGADPKRILGELRAAGFRTVILEWAEGWLISPRGWHLGQGKLACRPATAARWIYDNLYTQSATTAFCATGNSGGAAQVSYMIAHYGLADILSAVVPTAGPPTSRIDLGCLRYDPANEPLWYDTGNAEIIDRGFGYFNIGPCERSDFGFRKRFQEASLTFGNWQYNYPRTMVWLLFGEQDKTSAVGQGLLFHQRLLAEGSPLVRMNVIPNTGHGVQSSPEGANMIRDIMINECRPR